MNEKRPPLHVFRFHVRFREDAPAGEPGGDVAMLLGGGHAGSPSSSSKQRVAQACSRSSFS